MGVPRLSQEANEAIEEFQDLEADLACVNHDIAAQKAQVQRLVMEQTALVKSRNASKERMIAAIKRCK